MVKDEESGSISPVSHKYLDEKKQKTNTLMS